MKSRLMLPTSGMLAGMLLLGSVTLDAASFDEQRSAIAASLESQSEDAILNLLKAGIAENRPAPAVALANEWLRRNLPKNPALLFQAGRAAELSGEFKDSVAFYQQALKLADPKSAESGDAITAVYTLLIQQLDNPSGAFAFGLNEAKTLAINPRFRQFDRWFLDQAKTSNDRSAVASRLLASFQSGVTAEQIVALYHIDLRWLVDSIRSVRYDVKADRFTPQFVKDVKSLAPLITSDEEMRSLLDWSVSVKAYNMAKIDGKEASPPLAEAKVLMEKFPAYAAMIQTDWAGGSNSQHYRDDPKKYWTHETEAKMAPIRALLPKLSPLQQADLLRTWSSGYYASGPEVFSAQQALAFTLANPDTVNRKTGPAFVFGWDKLPLAEVQKLAPILALNPSPEASLIRSIATAGTSKDLDLALSALLGSEAWRLGPAELNGVYADRLWHWAGRPGGNAKRDEAVSKSKAFLATIAADPDAKAPPTQRIAAFQALLDDFMSPAPKTLSIRSTLAKQLRVTPEVIPQLIKDPRPEVQTLVREILPTDFMGPDTALNPDRFDPAILRKAARQGGMEYLKKRKPADFIPHALEPALRQAVADSLKQNKAVNWLTIAWINAQFPENNADSVKLMEELFASPVFATLSPEARFAARSWFGDKAMTPAQFAQLQSVDPKLVCKDLISLPKEADAVATTAAMTKVIEGLRKAPFWVEIDGLENLAVLSDQVFNDEKVQALSVEVVDSLRSTVAPPNFSIRYFTSVAKRKDSTTLLRSSIYLWRVVSVHHRDYPKLLTLAESLLEEQPSAASTLALGGLAAMDRHKQGHTWFKRETDAPLLKSIRGKAAMKLGLVVIPVAVDHPSYPVFQSQAEWLTGNEDSAWIQLDTHWDAFVQMHRELSIPYLMWTLQRTIYGRDEARQQMLIKSLLDWGAVTGSPLTPTEKAKIDIAYGDIALQRGQMREAHEIYVRVQKNSAYANLIVRHEAGLRRARAERIAKNFDAALQTLAELELERVPEIWTDARYARAEVNFDMENFDDAKDDIDSIIARDPNHADSRILLGKIQLKRQKLMEATEVELGSATGQKSLVPGENLKVTLSDPTLAVSGAGTEIEVVVWATSGDKETFFLRQFGDEKTKFRGEVATSLGSPTPGDNKLQVLGNDEVFYAYSETFLAKMNLTDAKRGGPITIASDASLMASARKLLTEAEQRSADMQLLMEQVGEGASSEAAKARIAAGEGKIDHSRHIATIAKPGNPIHVRVSDADRSRTAEIDELTVSASSSSGDSISRITLKETATHSGIFEGTIPTTGAQASAFAQNSEPGRAPNMVISPRSDYPAWRPVSIKGAIPDFTVDLNDNLPLDALTISAREPAAGLTHIIVQTAMNPSDWTSVATFPASAVALADPWKPSVTVVNEDARNHHHGARSVYEIEALRAHLAGGWLVHQPQMAIAKNVTGVSTALPQSIPTDIQWRRSGTQPNPAVVVRFQAYFHEKENVTRRFALDLGNIPDLKIPKDQQRQTQPAEFLIAVNGKVITTKDQRQLQGEINLNPGIHKIEIWATGWLSNIGFGRDLKLRANLVDPANLTDCPDSYFDPTTFPPGLTDQRNAPAAITANSDSTEFTVKFAKDSRARLIRLVMVAHQGSVPALNKLSLTQPDGTNILPVAKDFAELNKNDTLEILTGDKISVRYVDDRFISKTRERQERLLDVYFTDARVEFADMEPRFDSRHGEDMPYYEKLIRFLHNEPLSLAIHDADMDSSVVPDKVKVSLESATGTKEFEATETGDSTGIFQLTVTPVSNTAKNEMEFQVADGGMITARYMDQENNRPGVPTPRVATIKHAAFVTPEIFLSHCSVTPSQSSSMQHLHHGFEPFNAKNNQERLNTLDKVMPRWQLNHSMLPDNQAPEGGFQVALGQRVYLELLAPQLALGVASNVSVYAQTDAGRKAAAATTEGFNINAPGTILLDGWLGYPLGMNDPWKSVPLLPIYQAESLTGMGENADLDRFRLSVPLILGTLPSYGALTAAERYELVKKARESLDESESVESSISGLVVSPGERIHFGFRYTDSQGKEQWITASAQVITHPVFDIMKEDYRTPLTSAFVGENLNLRVVDFGADITDAPDIVSVLIQAKSGAKHKLELHESGPHTGIFKAGYQLSYADAKQQTESKPDGAETTPHDVRNNGFPVMYGDTVAARYTDSKGIKTDILQVTITKGADGSIEPFSKKYDDPQIAMRTQFSLAEAYLEVAKRHRKLEEHDAAALEYESAKQLLSKAMDQFTDPETRSHAEYLLGTLTMEEADATKEAELKETRYRAALSRFLNVTGSYGQTLHASKAQYQIATIYERLNEPEIAAQEYVKLAYKYPDSEFLATSMARLGTHFLKKASEYEAQAKPLLEKAKAEENKDAKFEGDALTKMAVAEYLKTAQIFGRLQQRFPSDSLAGQAGLRAGQAFMRAGKHQEAVDAFQRVIAEQGYDGKTIRAQAMYWVGMSYQTLKQPMAAYSIFKRLTYDFPESEWAAFARAQLSQEGLLDLESKLELERLEGEQR